jgi:hypothetical protein
MEEAMMNPRRKKAKGSVCGPYEPSPKDIRAACAHIQQAWTAKERAKRSGYVPEGAWTPPNVSWTAVNEAACEDLGADLASNSSV